MNKENKITLDSTGNSTLTYKLYYYDYYTGSPIKTLLYVGKAYNFISFFPFKNNLLLAFYGHFFQVFSIFGKSFLPRAGSIGRNRMRCAGDTTLDNKE